jgi:two-component system, OmpR family, phosphate regulon response regulator PhoB
VGDHTQKPTILVCDDDDGLRELMKVTLGDHYRYLEAVDADSGIALCRSEHPDLMLLDVMLPGRSGLHVLEEIRADDRTHDIPVVIVSAWQTPDDQAAASALGADAFLPKPFELRELTSTVATLLERRR